MQNFHNFLGTMLKNVRKKCTGAFCFTLFPFWRWYSSQKVAICSLKNNTKNAPKTTLHQKTQQMVDDGKLENSTMNTGTAGAGPPLWVETFPHLKSTFIYLLNQYTLKMSAYFLLYSSPPPNTQSILFANQWRKVCCKREGLCCLELPHPLDLLAWVKHLDVPKRMTI